MKPCPLAEGRAAGPIEARALAFLPLAPGTGEGLGLGLEGGLSEVILGVCTNYDEYSICEEGVARRGVL